MLYLSPVKNGHRKYWRVRKRPETVCLAYCWARVLVTIANIELFKPDSKCRLYTMLMCNVRYMAVVCEWVRVVYGNGICLNFNFGLKQLHGIFECCSGCVSVGLLYGLYRHLNGEKGAKRINVRHTHTHTKSDFFFLVSEESGENRGKISPKWYSIQFVCGTFSFALFCLFSYSFYC